jgi:1-deoxyxylulose-5-phosphate synthase
LDIVNFGTAGVKVSRLALGLGLRGQADPVAAQRMIEHALASGITLIDCANVYAPMDVHANFGQSEQILGKAIKGKRDDVVITSKVASRVGPGPNDAGLSRTHILREIDKTLARLQTDYLDVYLVHVYDQSTPLDETVRALDDVVAAGKARYVGCCNYDAWQVMQGLWIADQRNAAPFQIVQNQYSLLQRMPEQELFGVIRSQGLGMMAYSPLAVGLLSGLYNPKSPPPAGTLWGKRDPARYNTMMAGMAGRVIETLQDVAKEVGKTPAQVAIAWVLDHPEVTVAITGGDTIEHLDDNLGGVGWKLDPELRQRLDEVSDISQAHLW